MGCAARSSKGLIVLFRKLPSVVLLCVLGSCGLVGPALAQDASPNPQVAYWQRITGSTQRIAGLVDFYYSEKDDELHMAIRADQLGRDFIMPMSIARGAGQTILGGIMLNGGDNWIVQFKQVGQNLHFIRRNVNYTATPNTPLADALQISFTDAVLLALPIRGRSPDQRSFLIDASEIFMGDLVGFGLRPDRRRSTYLQVKGFPENVALQVSLVAAWPFETQNRELADPRGAQIVMHYGLSMLPPQGSYRPRLADDRVGYFLTARKDFSNQNDPDAFVRYVNRWNLVKADPAAAKSPPKDPIVFWIHRSVPIEYRPHVRAGILEWNKAFERVGIVNAIEVRDELPGDNIDPEDIRFNTIRWITSNRAFAVGPSRVNPLTGQILDADILFDESFLRFYREDYVTTRGMFDLAAQLRSDGPLAFMRLNAGLLPELAAREDELAEQWNRVNRGEQWADPAIARLAQQDGTDVDLLQRLVRPDVFSGQLCQIGSGMSQRLSQIHAMLTATGRLDPAKDVPAEFIGDAIKEIVMHEVGHTLGLRHNFKASSAYTLEQISDRAFTAVHGISASVMDYNAVNFAAPGQPQGDLFQTVLGAWDYAAIEYGYKPLPPASEAAELAKIAGRLGVHGLDFATDEDLRYNPDPRINQWDLADPLEYAQRLTDMYDAAIGTLTERVVAKGDGWQRARLAFGQLLGGKSRALTLAGQYIGGLYTARDHKDDVNARDPKSLIPAQKQYEALAFMLEKGLSPRAFNVPSDVLAKLAPAHWSHWGAGRLRTYAYPLQEQILTLQRAALARLLNPGTLRAMQNAELKAGSSTTILSAAEMMDHLTDTVWAETCDDAPAKPVTIDIDPLRRNLQREHYRVLARVALGPRTGAVGFFDYLTWDPFSATPADSRALARAQLRRIQQRIELTRNHIRIELTPTTDLHLADIAEGIAKTLEATMSINEP